MLPLIPGYLSFIAGVSLEAKRQVIFTSLFFILGFSLVFIALGASATVVGGFLMQRLAIFGMVAGVVLIIAGLRAIGVARVQTVTTPVRWLGAMVVGMSLAFGWTPWIGPILAAILAVASQQDSANQGIVLLSVYSLGLGIPFLLAALVINQVFTALPKIRRHYHVIEVTAGVLMIVVGVLIFTNRFTIIAQWLSPYLPTF